MSEGNIKTIFKIVQDGQSKYFYFHGWLKKIIGLNQKIN